MFTDYVYSICFNICYAIIITSDGLLIFLYWVSFTKKIELKRWNMINTNFVIFIRWWKGFNIEFYNQAALWTPIVNVQ